MAPEVGNSEKTNAALDEIIKHGKARKWLPEEFQITINDLEGVKNNPVDIHQESLKIFQRNIDKFRKCIKLLFIMETPPEGINEIATLLEQMGENGQKKDNVDLSTPRGKLKNEDSKENTEKDGNTMKKKNIELARKSQLERNITDFQEFMEEQKFIISKWIKYLEYCKEKCPEKREEYRQYYFRYTELLKRIIERAIYKISIINKNSFRHLRQIRKKDKRDKHL